MGEQKVQDLKAELEAASQAYQNMEADATSTIGEAQSRATQAESQVQGLRDELSAAADAFGNMQNESERAAQQAQQTQTELETIIEQGKGMLAGLQHELAAANQARERSEAELQAGKMRDQQELMRLHSELEELRAELSARPSVAEVDPELIEGLRATVAQQERMIDGALRLQTRAELALDRSREEATKEVEERRRVESMMQQLMDKLALLPDVDPQELRVPRVSFSHQ